MMEFMRKAAKSWVAVVLLGLLIVSFAIFGISDIFTAPLSTKNLAEIGSRSIGVESFRQDLQQRLQNMSRQSGNNITLEQARQIGLDRQVLDELVASAAVEEKAAALDLHVSATQIGQEIANNPAFRDSTGKFDPQGFRNILLNNNLTEAGYINSERSQRVRQALQGLASERKASRTSLEVFNQYVNETREARYFSTPVSEADLPKPTDLELKKQYDDNPQNYTAAEFRSIAILKVEPTDIMAKFTPTEEELVQFYDQNKIDYFEEERRTILQLTFPTLEAATAAKQRIVAGEDFRKIASELKLADKDFTFANKVRADFIEEKIAEAAFKSPAGTVTDPIESALATALLKIEAVTLEKQKTFTEAKEDITKRVQLGRAQEEITAIFDAVEDARASQTKFEDIAKRADIPLTVVPMVSIAGKDKDDFDVQLPSKTEVLRAAFGSDVGVDNDALTINDGYVWFDVRNITPSALKPFDQVKTQVTKDWNAIAMTKLVSTKAMDLVALAKGGTSFDAIATQRQAAVTVLPAIKRDGGIGEFNLAAAQALFASAEKSITWAPAEGGKSIIMIETGRVTVPPLNLASADTKNMSENISTGLTQDTFQVLGIAAKLSVKAIVNEDIWKQVISVAPTQ